MKTKDKSEKARNYIIGEVMKKNPGFDPKIVSEILDEVIKEKLNSEQIIKESEHE